MPPFKRSETTDQLVRYLASQDKGSEINYRELSQIVKMTVRSRTTQLTSARKILERDHNQIWVCIAPNVAVRRLTDPEIADRLPRWWLNGARRKLKRGGDQSEAVDLQQLDVNQQARFGIDNIQRELAFESLSKATRKRMEHIARGSSNDLPKFNILEWAISLMPRTPQERTTK
jgi:hypothetical protein